MDLVRSGALIRHGVRLIGANAEAIEKGEDRQLFKEAMQRIGLDVAHSGIAHTIEQARKVATEIGSLPLIIRPAFTLGGSGSGIAYNREEFEEIVSRGLDLIPGGRSAHRGVALGLEGIRDGGDAGQGGQLRGHLFHREP